MPGGVSLVPKIVLDPVPQLSGDLDLNSHKIADGGVLQLYNDAVNHKVVLNAASGNTSMIVAPNGTGAFMLSSGGDARGNYAVDLQIDRGSSSGNVASGASSIVAGAQSKASGNYACALGYQASAEGLDAVAILGGTASADYAIAIGLSSVASGIRSVAIGYQATASNSRAMAFGYMAIASGQYAVAFPGGTASATGSMALYSSTATATESLAICRGKTYLSYQLSQSNNLTISGVKAQTNVLVASRQTSGTTPNELLIANNSRLVLPDKTSWAFGLLVIARSTDSTSINAAWNIFGCIKRDTGVATTVIVGSVQYGTPINPDGLDCQVSADTTNGALKIQVTGLDGKTINWVARIEIAEISESL